MEREHRGSLDIKQICAWWLRGGMQGARVVSRSVRELQWVLYLNCPLGDHGTFYLRMLLPLTALESEVCWWCSYLHSPPGLLIHSLEIIPHKSTPSDHHCWWWDVCVCVSPSLGKDTEKTWLPVDLWARPTALRGSPVLGMWVSLAFPTPRGCCKDTVLR